MKTFCVFKMVLCDSYPGATLVGVYRTKEKALLVWPDAVERKRADVWRPDFANREFLLVIEQMDIQL